MLSKSYELTDVDRRILLHVPMVNQQRHNVAEIR